MSALPARELEGQHPRPDVKIRVPEDLPLPKPDVRKVFANLTPEGAKDFAQEILEALEKSRDQRDLRAVVEVVEAWHRTLLFVEDHPAFMDAWADPQEDDPPHTSEDIAKRLNVDV